MHQLAESTTTNQQNTVNKPMSFTEDNEPHLHKQRKESFVPGYSFGNIPVFAKADIILQPKLTISKQGDEYEQEADRIADKVMRMPSSQLQRKCACGGSCSKCKKGIC